MLELIKYKPLLGELEILNQLHFHGPFRFTKGEHYLFNSDYVNGEGIYIWTIKNIKNGENYIHYIGETKSFGKRHKEHLIQITGLNYRILDHEKAQEGIPEIIWEGLWRDKTANGPGELLNQYGKINKKVIAYIGMLNIYFAPSDSPRDIRKHIEGCIAKEFRRSHLELTLFYPKDNRTGTKNDKLNRTILISSDELISGLDNKYEI